MADVELDGCRTEPLASYLKALGLLRLVANQADPAAAGRWDRDTFVLRSELDANALQRFLVEVYAPTPLLAPWNKGSGFGAEDAAKSPKAFAAVETIADSHPDRLDNYRRSIRLARELTATDGWYDLPKPEQVMRCRQVLPDEAVEWLDASVVLATDRLTFPPILGTGGNDGRFDFASNFMARLAELFGLVKRPRGAASPEALARGALFGEPVKLDRSAIGQFDPAGAGGPGSSPLGSAESLANPWDFALALEGALMFASAASRRLGATVGVPSYPFIVPASNAGYASAADENSRGELWAPVWDRPATYPEIARLLGEGRAEYRGRQARSGLDLQRSLASLGVDRGVSRFTRFGLVERNGLATFAVPLDQVEVASVAGVAILGDVDRWVGGVRRAANLPASVADHLRAIDHAQMAFSRHHGNSAAARRDRARMAQDLLAEVAALHGLAVRSRSVAKAAPSAISGLRAEAWVPILDDGSVEHDLAVSLASLRRRDTRHGLLRSLLFSEQPGERPQLVEGLGTRPLVPLLADCLIRLRQSLAADPGAGRHGQWLGPVWSLPAPLEAVARFVEGDADDARLGRLLAGYLLLSWHRPTGRPDPEASGEISTHPLLAAVKPFFHVRPLVPFAADGSFRPSSGWPRLLDAHRASVVAEDAVRRLRINGFTPRVRWGPGLALGIDAERIAGACLVPVTDWSIKSLLDRVTVLPRNWHDLFPRRRDTEDDTALSATKTAPGGTP